MRDFYIKYFLANMHNNFYQWTMTYSFGLTIPRKLNSPNKNKKIGHCHPIATLRSSRTLGTLVLVLGLKDVV
jgi:hypothetical protein